jgi:hypothetical protein
VTQLPAVAKADMLMKGEDPENIKRENTLSRDLLPGKQFNYMLSNPPFGKDIVATNNPAASATSLPRSGTSTSAAIRCLTRFKRTRHRNAEPAPITKIIGIDCSCGQHYLLTVQLTNEADEATSALPHSRALDLRCDASMYSRKSLIIKGLFVSASG